MILGKLARCRITGFEGVVTGEATYLSGCRKVLLCSRTLGQDKGESTVNERWFDEGLLQIGDDIIVERPANHAVAAGGPANLPPR